VQCTRSEGLKNKADVYSKLRKFFSHIARRLYMVLGQHRASLFAYLVTGVAPMVAVFPHAGGSLDRAHVMCHTCLPIHVQHSACLSDASYDYN
jgi:hypothetical protein